MKQVYNQTSTYSADLFGVNSALYELGGLLVMHDASGCNSTYNTHDEPRWWTMDSMVYVSGLDESDAILGNDGRLIDDIVDVAEKEHPKFIGLTRSVLPTYMGTDLKGIARVIEKKTGIPAFGFQTNGMDTYIRGAGMAYRAIAERFCIARENLHEAHEAYDIHGDGGETAAAEAERPFYDQTVSKDVGDERSRHTIRRRPSINLIGVTPLDFSINGNVEALERTVGEMGFTLQSNWSMGCTLEELSHAPEADVSLVVSADGLSAAQYLYEKFGVPYVIGIPCGRKAVDRLEEVLCLAVETGKNQNFFTETRFGQDAAEKLTPQSSILLIGEAVHCASLRLQLELEYGCRNVTVLCPLEEDAGVLRDTDLHDTFEAQIAEAINRSAVVIADPVYRRITEPDVTFIDDPHDAYSGRMYHDRGRLFVGKNADLLRR